MKPDVHVQNPADISWFKSSYSSNEGGECIEVAPTEEAILVRDSKDASLPYLAVGRVGWTHFVRYAAGA
ncbi:DUF397 domain-containing protein [Streptomyces sp. NPDC088246]|uniref:DUF397 domain-containing protein n=1 Tax=Streptomyces sp. NPDC088246 TaxID=3365842 RepID=UPI003805F5B6